jgi:hypothetical protein
MELHKDREVEWPWDDPTYDSGSRGRKLEAPVAERHRRSRTFQTSSDDTNWHLWWFGHYRQDILGASRTRMRSTSCSPSSARRA